MELLNETNFQKGFLLDDELLAGVAEHPDKPGLFLAWMVSQFTGEYVGLKECTSLPEALFVVNEVDRDWQFESTGCGKPGCKGGNCGAGEKLTGGSGCGNCGCA